MASEELHGTPAAARTRRRRSVITFLIVLLLLFFAIWYALSYIRADEAHRAGAAAAASGTRSEPACSLTPQDVEVNVFNATGREDLAARVATDLKKRGFVVRTVANDPKHEEVAGRGHLRFGDKGARPAELVARHVGSFQEQRDERQRAGIDIVLGPQFHHLVREASIPGC